MFGYKKMYIDGKLVDAADKQKHTVYCPATDTPVAEIAWATKADTERALVSAKKALPLWSHTPVAQRTKYMERLCNLVIEHQEQLREAEMYEHGKTWEQTEEGYLGVVQALTFYAEEIKRMHGHLLVDNTGTHEHKITYHSGGVVGAFLAWNFPLLNLAFKLGPAMASGSPIIIRPSAETPISAYMLAELCAKADLPPGVVQILAGTVSNTADVITTSTVPSMLTLIGSTRTGLAIMKNGTTSVKRYSMELGGNAPAIVFKDANIEQTAATISMLKFANAGQVCVTPNRVFVHKDIADEFIQAVVSLAQAVMLGHGKDSGATMGPLINSSARDRIDAWVQEAVSGGATLHYGGCVPAEFADAGSYYAPTVLSNVSADMNLCCDEIFGPVVAIQSFTEYADVIARANDTDMGLASYIFSNNHATIQKASRDLAFGEVQVNGVKYNMDLPHIGIKQSGIGLDGSHFALEEYMVKKRVTTTL